MLRDQHLQYRHQILDTIDPRSCLYLYINRSIPSAQYLVGFPIWRDRILACYRQSRSHIRLDVLHRHISELLGFFLTDTGFRLLRHS